MGSGSARSSAEPQSEMLAVVGPTGCSPVALTRRQLSACAAEGDQRTPLFCRDKVWWWVGPLGPQGSAELRGSPVHHGGMGPVAALQSSGSSVLYAPVRPAADCRSVQKANMDKNSKARRKQLYPGISGSIRMIRRQNEKSRSYALK